MELSFKQTLERQQLVRACIETNYMKLIKFFANHGGATAASGYHKATEAYFAFCQTKELTLPNLELLYATTREALKFIEAANGDTPE